MIGMSKDTHTHSHSFRTWLEAGHNHWRLPCAARLLLLLLVLLLLLLDDLADAVAFPALV